MEFSQDSAQNILNDYIIPYGLNLLFAIIIFFVGRLVARLITNLARSLLLKAKVDEILIDFIAGIISSLLMLFVIIASVGQLGVDTTSLIALIGAAGLAVGLSLQSSLQNFASGVMLIVFRPFTLGDFVEVAGIAGIVEKISIFSTQLKTVDNKALIVPNGKIYGDIITNFSAKEIRRVDMVFGVSYECDLQKTKRILQEIIDTDQRILPEPAPLIAVSELADSSVNFVVRPWAKSSDYWGVYFDTHEKVKLTFDEENLSIPYPQMDIHISKQEG